MQTRNVFASALGVALAVAASLLAQPPARADDGHQHADARAPGGNAALPRFALVSDTFELVGVLDGVQLTLYLDHAADNSPVPGATVELDIGGARSIQATPHGAGAHDAVLPAALPPGHADIVATVTLAGVRHVLNGALDVPTAAPTPGAAAAHTPRWRHWAAWAVGGMALLTAAAVLLSRARRRGKQAALQGRAGSAA